MKIRIESNTLRLRLRKSEIDVLEADHVVSDVISFGSKSLIYRLKINEVEQIESSFSDNIISVSLPKELALEWINSDLVSLQNDTVSPKILIEKDFQCTSKACIESENDQSDFFENPK